MIRIQYICDICKKEIDEHEIAHVTLTRTNGDSEEFQIHDACAQGFQELLSQKPKEQKEEPAVKAVPQNVASESAKGVSQINSFVSAQHEGGVQSHKTHDVEYPFFERQESVEKDIQSETTAPASKIRALTDAQIEEMVAMYNAGDSKEEIAKRFGIKPTTVVQKMSALRKNGRTDIVRRVAGGPSMKFDSEEPAIKDAENKDDGERTAEVKTGHKEFQSGSFSSQNSWEVVPFEEDDLAKEIAMTKEDMQRIMIAYYFGGIGLVKSRLNISSRIVDIVKQLATKYYQEPLNALYNSSSTNDSRVQLGDKSVEWRVVCNLFVTKWKIRDIAWELKIDESMVPRIIELYSGVK